MKKFYIPLELVNTNDINPMEAKGTSRYEYLSKDVSSKLSDYNQSRIGLFILGLVLIILVFFFGIGINHPEIKISDYSLENTVIQRYVLFSLCSAFYIALMIFARDIFYSKIFFRNKGDY